jgi:arylsulfatase A-like enzyme
MWGYELNENGVRHRYGDLLDEDPALYQTDVLRNRAVDVIRRRAGSGRPLFLSIAFLAPHMESRNVGEMTGVGVRPAQRHRGRFAHARLPRPPSFDERDVSDKPPLIRHRPRFDSFDVEDIRNRYRWRQESLLAVDEAVRAIVTELEAQGQLDNTYLLFTSDNGFMQGQHRVGSGKVLPYDPSTRVPLLIRGPGIPAAEESDELVGNIDLAPTILRIAGATPGKVVDGRPGARLPAAAAARDGRAALRAGCRRRRGRGDHAPGLDLSRGPHATLAVGRVPRRQP